MRCTVRRAALCAAAAAFAAACVWQGCLFLFEPRATHVAEHGVLQGAVEPGYAREHGALARNLSERWRARSAGGGGGGCTAAAAFLQAELAARGLLTEQLRQPVTLVATSPARGGFAGSEGVLLACALPTAAPRGAGAAGGAPPLPQAAFLQASLAAALAGARWLGKDLQYVFVCPDGHEKEEEAAGDQGAQRRPVPLPLPIDLAAFVDAHFHDTPPLQHARRSHSTPQLQPWVWRVARALGGGGGGGGPMLLEKYDGPSPSGTRRVLLAASATDACGTARDTTEACPAPPMPPSPPPPPRAPQPPLRHHVGALRAALVLQLPDAWAPAAHVHLHTHGLNGALPELDFYSLVAHTYRSHGAETLPVRGTCAAAERLRARLRRALATHAAAVSRACALVNAHAASGGLLLGGGAGRAPVHCSRDGLRWCVDAAADSLTFLHRLVWPATVAAVHPTAGGGGGSVRLPPHAQLLLHGVNALTVSPAATDAADGGGGGGGGGGDGDDGSGDATAGAPAPGPAAAASRVAAATAAAESIVWHGRALERVLRGVVATDERLHASPVFYVLPTPLSFVGIDSYALPLVLLHAPGLLLLATSGTAISGRQLVAVLAVWLAAAGSGAAALALLWQLGEAGVPPAALARVAAGCLLGQLAAAVLATVSACWCIVAGRRPAEGGAAACEVPRQPSPPPPPPAAASRAAAAAASVCGAPPHTSPPPPAPCTFRPHAPGVPPPPPRRRRRRRRRHPCRLRTASRGWSWRGRPSRCRSGACCTCATRWRWPRRCCWCRS